MKFASFFGLPAPSFILRPGRSLLPFFLCGFLILCLGLTACGKKGYPTASDSSQSFVWTETEAVVTGKCLTITGQLEGSYGNLESVRFELEPINGPDDCPGCPFVPKEIHEYAPVDANFNNKTGKLNFMYCPNPAQAYRWRLIGVSIYSSFPHAISPVKMVIND